MAAQATRRSDTLFTLATTAMLLVGLLVFGHWFVATIGGEIDMAELILGLGLVRVATAIRMIR